MNYYKYTLKDVIRSKKYSDSIKKLFTQLLLAIHTIHSNGFIHRDLKPNNILVDTDMNLVVCDFGLSIMDFFNYDNKEACSIWYRPPEVVMHKRHTNKIDIWALGCIYAEMLMKEPLFPARDGEQLTMMINDKSSYTCLDNVDKVSKADRDIILQMLNPNPECRPNINNIMQHFNVNSDDNIKFIHPLLNKISYIDVKNDANKRMEIINKIIKFHIKHFITDCATFLTIKCFDICLLKQIKYSYLDVMLICSCICIKFIYGILIDNNAYEAFFETKLNIEIEIEIYKLLNYNLNFSTFYNFMDINMRNNIMFITQAYKKLAENIEYNDDAKLLAQLL